jgi:glycosyltransferase involved in cell wall biosynthesis
MIIILDEEDGTPDKSAGILRSWEGKDHRVFGCIRNFKINPANARNLGLIYAMEPCSPFYAEYICLLDADDLWYPDKLEEQIAFMDSHQEYGYSWMGGMEQRNGAFTAFTDATTIHFTSSMMIRRSTLEKLQADEGYIFDESLSQSDDADLFIRLKRISAGAGISGYFVGQEIRSESLTNCWWKCLLTHTRIALKHGRYYEAVRECIVSPAGILWNKIKGMKT